MNKCTENYENRNRKANEVMRYINQVPQQNVREFKGEIYKFLKERKRMYPERYKV